MLNLLLAGALLVVSGLQWAEHSAYDPRAGSFYTEGSAIVGTATNTTDSPATDVRIEFGLYAANESLMDTIYVSTPKLPAGERWSIARPMTDRGWYVVPRELTFTSNGQRITQALEPVKLYRDPKMQRYIEKQQRKRKGKS